MTAPTTRRATLAARRAKRQQYIDRAVANAKLLGLTLTCAEKPVEWHGTCLGLEATANDGLGCLCTCHDAELSRGGRS